MMPFFYLGFLSRTFTIHRAAGEGGGYLFNSSLPLSHTSQTLRHQPVDYCRQLTSADCYQQDSNQEPLFSERKSLTAKPRAIKHNFHKFRDSYHLYNLTLLHGCFSHFLNRTNSTKSSKAYCKYSVQQIRIFFDGNNTIKVFLTSSDNDHVLSFHQT